MKKLLLALLILTSSLVGQNVEHAPTVEQCHADQRLWLAQHEEDVGNNTHLPNIHIIRRWAKEMNDCEKVDPTNQLRYYNTISELMTEEKMRMEHFLDRHQLWEQFVAEDAAGKR